MTGRALNYALGIQRKRYDVTVLKNLTKGEFILTKLFILSNFIKYNRNRMFKVI